MAEPAIRAMAFDEFFYPPDGTDTRYELISGFPVAMALPAQAHGMQVETGVPHRVGRTLVTSQIWW